MLLRGGAGTAALLHGDFDTARRAFRDQLELCQELVVEPAAYQGLRGLAALAAAGDDLRRAAVLAGAADARCPNGPGDAVDLRVDAAFFAPARARHGGDAWDAAVHAGAALNFADALAYAVEGAPA